MPNHSPLPSPSLAWSICFSTWFLLPWLLTSAFGWCSSSIGLDGFRSTDLALKVIYHLSSFFSLYNSSFCDLPFSTNLQYEQKNQNFDKLCILGLSFVCFLASLMNSILFVEPFLGFLLLLVAKYPITSILFYSVVCGIV